jgi:hypothetical protein
VASAGTTSGCPIASGSLRRLWDREREDLLTLATVLLLVPLTWVVVLGWRPPRAVFDHDGTSLFLLVAAELSEVGGHWDALLWRADLLGGVEVRDAVGPFPPLAWLARLGLGPTAMLVGATFLLQMAFAFLGIRTATDLAHVWRGSRPPPSPLLVLAGVWLCGFAPVLGWRVANGHLTLMAGMVPFLATVALVSASAAGTLGVVLAAVAAGAASCGLLFTGHQMVLYGAVFGGAIVAGLWRDGPRGGRLAGPLLALLGALCLALPSFWPVLCHALSSDSLRSLGGMGLAYSYLTSTPLDWITSLGWTRDAIPLSRPAMLHHETNLPLGPIVVFLALVPWGRARGLAAGLGVSVALGLAFSMRVPLLADALLWLIPPLNSFRVPSRALLPVLAVVPILALAAATAAAPRTRWRHAIAALVLALALLALPSLARDVLAWGVVGAGALVVRRRPLLRAGAASVLLGLAGGAVGAFGERLPAFEDTDALLARTRALGHEVRRAHPELASPLTRTRAAFVLPAFGANTAWAMGLSAPDGYLFPNRRFVELVTALREHPYTAAAMLLHFPESYRSSWPVYRLFNVTSVVESSDSGGGLRVRPLVKTAGPAWFSATVVAVPDFPALARTLAAEGDALPRRAHEVAWVVESDPLVAAAGVGPVERAACQGRLAEVVETQLRGQHVRVQVAPSSPCPLTVAMSYDERLRATGRSRDGVARPLVTFPAYGALLGVWVPDGLERVDIDLVAPKLPFALGWRLLGVLLVGLAGLRGARGSRTRPGRGGAGEE